MIAIIGLLVGLLLPAVQRARESGRRTSCANKIRQVALAVVGYESATGTFPPAFMESGRCRVNVTGTNREVPSATRQWCITNMSGMVFLLPHLEQSQLYDRANMNAAFGDVRHVSQDTLPSVGLPARNFCGSSSANYAVTMTRLDVLECPTALTGNSTSALPTGYTDPTRFVSYQGMGRTTNYLFVTTPAQNVCDGWRRRSPITRWLFGEESFAHAAAVRDGLSNVLMLGETTSNMAGQASAPGQAWAFLGDLSGGVSLLDKLNMWRVNPSQPGALWDYGCPGSEHPGGCHFAMGDGSARFVSEATNGDTLIYLAQIADGKATSADLD